MAKIITDFMECECGNEDFKEETICVIKNEAARASRNEDQPFSDRYLDSKKVRYICTRCGKVLQA